MITAAKKMKFTFAFKGPPNILVSFFGSLYYEFLIILYRIKNHYSNTAQNRTCYKLLQDSFKP